MRTIIILVVAAFTIDSCKFNASSDKADKAGNTESIVNAANVENTESPEITDTADKTGRIDGHTGGKMDIMLPIFEGKNPVKVGEVKENGELFLNLALYSPEYLERDEKMHFIEQVSYGFQYVCDEADLFPYFDNHPKAKSIGYFELWSGGSWYDNLFAASNKELRYWMQNPGYLDAVKGSFYHVVLCTQNDVHIKHRCSNTDFYDNVGDKRVEIEYDLVLHKGLNLVEYQILSVFKPESGQRGAFPDKIKIINANEHSSLLWLRDISQADGHSEIN